MQDPYLLSAALRLQLPHRPHFDAALTSWRDLRCDPQRFIVRRCVDQIETGELFLGFREGTIGDRDAPAADPHCLCRLATEQRFG